MQIRFFYYFLLVALLFTIPLTLIEAQEDSRTLECTIGVACGNVTHDKRPLLWKTRDMTVEPNFVIFDSTSTYKFISVTTKQTNFSWMGVNEQGFAIVASQIYDLTTTITNNKGINSGKLMNIALGTCKTIKNFEELLDETNKQGRSGQANFAVIDATGEAALFETGGNIYYKYNTRDSQSGFIIRTNFSLKGNGNNGIDRYHRSNELISNFIKGDSLNYKSIIRYQMRDFSDYKSKPYKIPSIDLQNISACAYIDCNHSICNKNSVAACVIHGILPGESPELTTMWTMLGFPATSMAIPYWPVGTVPEEASNIGNASLYNISNNLKQLVFDNANNNNYINTFKLINPINTKNNYNGLWNNIFPIEDQLFYETEHYLDSIRLLDKIPILSMLKKEKTISKLVYEKLLSEYNAMQTFVMINPEELDDKNIIIYSNPTTSQLIVNIKDLNNIYIIKIYDLLGNIIQTRLIANETEIFDANRLHKGLYIVEVSSKQKSVVKKIIMH